MQGLGQDIRFVWRTARRNPGFAVTTTLLVAAGIALSATAFSLVRAYLIRPLPYPDADRVMQIIADERRTFADVPRGFQRLDLAGMDAVFDQVAAWDLDGFTVVGGEQPEFVDGAWVNAGFFSIVGGRAALGRLIDIEDVRQSAKVAVISHAFWQRHFGGRQDVVGQPLRAFSTDRPLIADLYSVVGVLPQDFWHVNRFTDILTPLTGPRVPSLVRLKDGVTRQEAIDQLNVRARATFPDANPDWRVTLVSAQEEYALLIRPTMLILLGAVVCVLLVATANVTGLLLVRGVSRGHELTLRAALGAPRGRLMRQMLVESLTLALAGGVFGIWLAVVSLGVLGPWVESQLGVGVPGGVQNVRIDLPMLAVALPVTLLVGLVAGLRPAMLGARNRLTVYLGGASRVIGSTGRHRFRAAMVAGQVGLSFVLLVGTGLWVRSLLALNAADLGFDPTGVLKAHMLLPQARYADPASRMAAMQQVFAAVGSVPGVDAVASVLPHPFRNQGGAPVEAENAAPTERPATLAVHHVIGGDYFGTMRITVIEGRPFSSADTPNAEPVAIVSADLARRLWPDQRAIGRRIRTGGPDSPWRSIVGVVQDVRKTFNQPLHGDTYVPYTQAPGGYVGLMVRTAGDPAALGVPVQQALATIAPDLPLHEIEPMTGVVERQGIQTRFLSILLSAFSGLTLVIALVGLYSVLAFTVGQRTREIALRVAVGASRTHIAAAVGKEGVVLVGIGLAAGLLLSLALTRIVGAHLFGVRPFDLVSWLSAAVLLGSVAAAAVIAPALRAAGVDPVAALRTN